MSVKIVSSPSHLGQSEYVLPIDRSIRIQALVDTKELKQLQIDLWASNATGQEWTAHRFEAVKSQSKNSSSNFEVVIPAADRSSLDFTIRYRAAEGDEWTWLGEPGEHAHLLLLEDETQRQTQLQGVSSLKQLFTHHDDKLQLKVVPSSVGKTKLFVVSCEAVAQAPDYTEISFGKPTNLVQWISLERLMSFWMEPNQGREVLNTPRDSYMVAYQRTDGLHIVMLPLSGLKNDCQSHFKTDKSNGELIMYTKNDGKSTAQGQVIVGVGLSLDAAIDASFQYTRQLFQNDHTLAPAEREEKKVEAKWFEEFADGLFYCSWNAMYTDVSEDKLLEVVDGLDKLGVKVSGIIIDDGWQDIDDKRRWKSFVPPKDRFPHGLSGFVKTVKKRYPYIKHVGVWHALCGYWNAFSPDSWISEHYKVVHVPMRKITVPEGLNENHFVDPADIRRLYDDFYKYLTDEGITMVKCDVQAVPDDISHAHPQYRRMWRDYQDAFRQAALKHFDMKVIYCMSHVSDIFLSSLLQRNVNPPCLRNSNDFFPDQEDSHAWHIFWNASNALYTSRLNCLPDWDMFETTHPQARFHAISRSLSGGPVLITDKLEESDERLIECMTSLPIAPTNETRIVRFTKPGVSRYPYAHFRDGRCTKVINSTYDLLTLGVFNTTEESVLEAVCLDDFTSGALKDTDEGYVVTRYSDSACRRATTRNRKEPLFMAELQKVQAEIFTAAPVLQLSKTRQCAVLGLLNKFAGAVGINWYRVTTHAEEHQVLEIQISHLGHLGVYVHGFKVNVDRLLITMREVVIEKSAVSIKHDGEVLVIDLLEAWKALGGGGDGWWSNEVNVKIYFRS